MQALRLSQDHHKAFVVFPFEEDALSIITPMDHVMGKSGGNGTGTTRHRKAPKGSKAMVRTPAKRYPSNRRQSRK
jgi:hypothetical protein